jgi:hypothetical protein
MRHVPAWCWPLLTVLRGLDPYAITVEAPPWAAQTWPQLAAVFGEQDARALSTRNTAHPCAR